MDPLLGTSRNELSVCHSHDRSMYCQAVSLGGMTFPASSTLETR